MLFLDVASFFGYSVIRDLCTSSCRQNFANFYLYLASVILGGCPMESFMHELDLLKIAYMTRIE